MKKRLNLEEYNRPELCTECDGIMIFQGLGQYKCENCGRVEHDDYGKVRNFVEDNPGANVAVISDETGVNRRAINNMVREGRFEITRDSKTFLRCEMCGVNIRSGRVCNNCEAAYHREREEDIRTNNVSGFGKATEEAKGSKRFRRGM